MLLTDFQFPFDPALIASHPIRPRDHARLLVVPRHEGGCRDEHVFDLPELLNPGDLLVVNDTRVIPARVVGTKHPGGGKVELLVVRPCGGDHWEVLMKGRLRIGQRLSLAPDVQATIVERHRDRTLISVKGIESWSVFLDRVGRMPLPPYIKRQPTEEDRQDYQTMFARQEGAIAAPTAGLHFTPRLLEALLARGIQVDTITLHVGPGTFKPVTVDRIEEHQMDPEWFEVPAKTADAIAQAKQRGCRIVAVGTTVTRSLESAADESGKVCAGQGETGLFVTPGYRFRVVDALMTNFHLPGTTLLMLVGAFAGVEQARRAYAHAVKERYRFYSYGDTMLIR